MKCNDVIYSVWIHILESLTHITSAYFYFVLSAEEHGESVGCVSYPLSAPYLKNRDKHALFFLHRYSKHFHWVI